jgi:hypothetical protein
MPAFISHNLGDTKQTYLLHPRPAQDPQRVGQGFFRELVGPLDAALLDHPGHIGVGFVGLELGVEARFKGRGDGAVNEKNLSGRKKVIT